jgi:hypothetical protein
MYGIGGRVFGATADMSGYAVTGVLCDPGFCIVSVAGLPAGGGGYAVKWSAPDSFLIWACLLLVTMFSVTGQWTRAFQRTQTSVCACLSLHP